MQGRSLNKFSLCSVDTERWWHLGSRWCSMLLSPRGPTGTLGPLVAKDINSLTVSQRGGQEGETGLSHRGHSEEQACGAQTQSSHSSGATQGTRQCPSYRHRMQSITPNSSCQFRFYLPYSLVWTLNKYVLVYNCQRGVGIRNLIHFYVCKYLNTIIKVI